MWCVFVLIQNGGSKRFFKSTLSDDENEQPNNFETIH